jgi:hypothetical protein
MDPVTGQQTNQQQAIAGAGAAANPWAEFGLNPDGTPIPQQTAPKPDPAAVENAQLKAKVVELEQKIAKLPDNFDGMSKRLDLVDRLVKAFAGDSGQQQDSAAYQQVWGDLKEVTRRVAPEAHKLLDLLEKNPGALDSLASKVSNLEASHVISLNEKAHDRVLDLAKKAGFKAGTTADLNEMVFPFEQSMTMMINSNPELRRAFLSGNLQVVDQIFSRMIKPHVAQRLRDKQSRMQSPVTKATPRGGAAAAGATEETQPRRDLSTPKGKADFHKQAVGRWLDKISSRSEE